MNTIKTTTMTGGLPATRTATTKYQQKNQSTQSGLARVLPAVAASVQLALSSNGETVTTVDWLARTNGDTVHIIHAAYSSGEFDSKLGVWVKSTMPGEEEVTFDTLKMLEGERADLVVSGNQHSGFGILNVLPAGRLT